jgi:transcriptional regulator with XRE-family HTH domain
MKHTRPRRPISLSEARARVPGLTQQQLELRSGVDRTRISKLESQDDPRVFQETYEKLDGALRKCGALKPSEKLVFGQREAIAS